MVGIVDFRLDYVNPMMAGIGRVPASEQVGHTFLELFPAHRTNGLFEAYRDVVETGRPFAADDFHYVDPDAAGGALDQYLDLRAAKLGDGYLHSVQDVSERHRGEFEMRRLALAIEQSADSIVITDTAGRIEYVNPAFERVSGYTRAEVIGQNPRIVKSDVQEPAFYAAMWATLASGRSFTADFTNRRKDGSLFLEESVISPILDEAGEITSYLAVKRDMTRERAYAAAATRTAHERALIAETLRGIHEADTVETTAQMICRQVLGLSEIMTASIYMFELDRRATALGFAVTGRPDPPLRRLPVQRSRRLAERAAKGTWIEPWVNRPWHPYNTLLTGLGVHSTACAPIFQAGRLIGLLVVDTQRAPEDPTFTEVLPALVEFAELSGAIIGRDIDARTRLRRGRESVAAIIRAQAFRAAFQPVVDITTGVRIGYEALTRFATGTPPDVVFAKARAAGLEAELELATLAAAISAAAVLPKDAWLSLNVSPSLVTGGPALGRLLRKVGRPVVLEITEHVPVDDYPAVRTAIARLRPKVRVAIDDAGSGIANFHHIVELRPDFVKLDITLVRGIDIDLTRQALVVGLLQFAAESGSQTIAEGVETEEELATLRRLGVSLVQGYLLGRPAPPNEWVDRPARLVVDREAGRQRVSR